jgi:phosphatidate cytidylyltransferase
VSVVRVSGESRLAPLFRNEMLVRFASAAILATLTLAAAWFGGWAAAAGVSAAVIAVHLEWIGLTRDRLVPALAFTALLVASFALFAAGYPAVAAGLTGLAVVAAAAASRGLWRPAGVVYAAVLGLGLLLLRGAPEQGLPAVLVVFAVVWGTDSGAFFAGRAIGGPRLWPAVSPKKTWAGAIGGLAAGIAAGLVMAALARVTVTPELALVCALLSLADQAGDLFESAIKRHFGAKDSGIIVPGHGGLMDRVDGLVFAVAAAAIIGLAHGGPSNLAAGLLTW